MPDEWNKEPAVMYYMDLGLYVNYSEKKDGELQWCAHFSVDFSLLPKINIEEYSEIFRKHVPWKEEHYFEAGRMFVNVNYIRHRLNDDLLRQDLERGDIWNIHVNRKS